MKVCDLLCLTVRQVLKWTLCWEDASSRLVSFADVFCRCVCDFQKQEPGSYVEHIIWCELIKRLINLEMNLIWHKQLWGVVRCETFILVESVLGVIVPFAERGCLIKCISGLIDAFSLQWEAALRRFFCMGFFNTCNVIWTIFFFFYFLFHMNFWWDV